MSYTVTARRWSGGWELHIDDVGVTQSRSLATAEQMIRSYLAMDDYADASTAEITITPELDPELGEEIDRARRAISDASKAQQEAAKTSRRAVANLKASGLSGRDVAQVLGVSTQRVSQLS